MIYVNKADSTPLYQQLYTSIIEEITNGSLSKNSALPPIRTLSEKLNISLNTVSKAYLQLTAEGYVRSVPGSGYYVEDISNTFLDTLSVPPVSKKITSSISGQNPAPKATPVRYDFKHDVVYSHLFPWKLWRQYVNNALLQEENQKKIQYESNKGNYELRSNICHYLNRNRGVHCDPEQVILVPGTQYGIEIISRLLPAEKHRIAYEEPSHNGIRNIFLQNGYELFPIPVVENGIDIDKLFDSCCNLLYVMPSHQFPTGRTIPVSNRLRLLEWAIRNDAYIIENDYDSEFPHQTRPIPSLQSLDHYDHVIYFNTFAKILTPSMRTAFFVLPYSLLDKYEQMYRYFNAALPSFNQIALSNFIASGDFERHLRKLVKINEHKYNLLLKSMHTFLSSYMDVVDTPAGSHIIVRIRNCTNQQKLIDALCEKSISIYGVQQYFHTGTASEDIFLLGFSSLEESEIPEACEALARALSELL